MGPLKVALLATILAFAAAAHAQGAKKAEADTAAEPAADAAAHYRKGVAAFEAGKFSEALAAFTEAYNLSSETDLLYNLGVCSEKIGNREKAIAYYQLYLEEKPDAPDAAEVKARLDAIRAAPAPGSAPATPAPAAADAEEGAGTASEGGERKNPNTGPALLMGLGGLVVVTGAVTAGSAYKKYQDLDSACAPDCADDKVDGVKAAALAADIQLAVGGAAVVAGFLWWLLKTRHEESATSGTGDDTARLSAAPFAAADGGGVRLEGRF